MFSNLYTKRDISCWKDNMFEHLFGLKITIISSTEIIKTNQHLIISLNDSIIYYLIKLITNNYFLWHSSRNVIYMRIRLLLIVIKKLIVLSQKESSISRKTTNIFYTESNLIFVNNIFSSLKKQHKHYIKGATFL